MTGQQNPISPLIILRLLIVVLLLSFLPVIAAGRWDWLEGWTYGIILSSASWPAGVWPCCVHLT